MVSNTLALDKYSVIYLNVKQGSSPGRGQRPVEWGDFSTRNVTFVNFAGQRSLKINRIGLRAS